MPLITIKSIKFRITTIKKNIYIIIDILIKKKYNAILISMILIHLFYKFSCSYIILYYQNNNKNFFY